MEPDGDFVAGAVVVHALDERLQEAGLVLGTGGASGLVFSGRLVTQSLQLVQPARR
jgi:hypothetical protein